MIRRIILKNYMSHRETVLELAPGLTVLAGPNNCGKSAVVSALQTLCYNEGGGYMVRHEEKCATITVETDDGHTVTWKRDKGIVSYEIDGEAIHRLKGQPPKKLHQILKLPQVVAEGGKRFDIHFGTQKAPIFLLNEPGSRAAMFFASASDASKLLKMQELHRDKGRKTRERRTVFSNELQRCERELEALSPVAAAEERLKRVEKKHQEITRVEDHIEALQRLLTRWQKLEASSSADAERGRALTTLKAAPVQHDVAALAHLWVTMTACRQAVEWEAATVKAAEALKPPQQVVAEVPRYAVCVPTSRPTSRRWRRAGQLWKHER